MTLLFDQNLSHRLVARLGDIFPGSVHVRSVGLGSETDEIVWEYARQQGLTLVSKDSDFASFNSVRGHPPKVIWIRRGNCTTDEIVELLRANQMAIASFLFDSESGCLQLL